VPKTGTTATQPAVAGKVKTKPSANTKSFLQEMRRKKMHHEPTVHEDLIFVSGTSVMREEVPSRVDQKKSEEALKEIKEEKEVKVNCVK
jgi:hypothetical protein